MLEIKEFFEIYKNAAWEKDSTAMINLYDGDAIIFDMWNQGYIADAFTWADGIRNWLGSLGDEKVRVEFEMVTIHHSGNTGFASALIQFQALSADGTVLRSMKNRISLGFSKNNEEWKVIHQHTSAPISSDGLNAILDI